jgi:hypothetical protein
MPGAGEVLAFATTGGTDVPLQDRLGSAIGLVNSSNSLQTRSTTAAEDFCQVHNGRCRTIT